MANTNLVEELINTFQWTQAVDDERSRVTEAPKVHNGVQIFARHSMDNRLRLFREIRLRHPENMTSESAPSCPVIMAYRTSACPKPLLEHHEQLST